MVSTVANGGTCYYPRLVDRIESPDPNERQAVRQFPRARVRSRLFVKQESLAIVQEAMYADVAEEEGTGRSAAIEGYDVRQDWHRRGTGRRQDHLVCLLRAVR